MSEHVLVLTTMPDLDAAEHLAEDLVQARLAACVNILPQVQSIYMWQGKPCKDTEHLVFIKTTGQGYPKLQSYIQNRHPYELPEIIGTPITRGLEKYLDWVAQGVNV